VRINSKGVVLSQADFAMSKIAANETYNGSTSGKRLIISVIWQLLRNFIVRLLMLTGSLFLQSISGKLLGERMRMMISTIKTIRICWESSLHLDSVGGNHRILSVCFRGGILKQGLTKRKLFEEEIHKFIKRHQL